MAVKENMKTILLLALFLTTSYSVEETKTDVKYLEYPEMKKASADLSVDVVQVTGSGYDGTYAELQIITRKYIYVGDSFPRQRIEEELSDWRIVLKCLHGQLPIFGKYLVKRNENLKNMTDAQLILLHRAIETLIVKLENAPQL